ncbi:MAG: hypothetical protein NTY90_01795 [Candidatus Micrarchaeota archaeon]|nr:hypothetical protein [Candidatus Micrarchaeota archaeon]
MRLFEEKRVLFAIAVAALALLLIFMRDFNPTTVDSNFGIEFIGGVRIPISLETAVDAATMGSMIDTIKLRINKYGLSQSVVRPLGDQEIIVEIPKAESSVISSVEKILREQGKFEGIVDGRVAVSGADIMVNAVGGAGSERVEAGDGSTRWELDFAVTREGGERFAKAAMGKANYPVYMFLDRPENAALILSRNEMNATGMFVDKAVAESLKKEGDDITLLYAEDFNASGFAKLNKTLVVIGKTTLKEFAAVSGGLASLGYAEPKPGEEGGATRKIIVKSDDQMAPKLYQSGVESGITEWRAIGLLSAPTLSPGLANGYVTQFYSITGGAAGDTPEQQKANAVKEIKELKSVISGGKLPVSTIIGSAYTVEATLGRQFLTYSFIATILAIFAVSIVIMARYRIPKLIVPIVLVNSAEILILFALVGSFGTIDLAAMAGIITLIGTGINDQLVITDEMLRKRETGEAVRTEERDAKEKLGKAFEIIFTVAGVSVVSMLPLLLSGIVEMMGFALSCILGVLIGVGITRPAYGAVMEMMFGKRDKAAQ